MSNLSAALGLAQLKYLDEWVKKKRRIYEVYKKINDKKEIVSWIDEEKSSYSNRWLSVFLFPSYDNMENAYQKLKSKKIECRRFWKPLHKLGIYKNQKAYISGVSEDLFERGICLPSGVGLTGQEQEEIIRIVRT
jgi:dTDP-4-amino-4,6-dideoxygalactose transaminase